MEVELLLKSAQDLARLAYSGFPKGAALSSVSAKYSLSKRDLFALVKVVRWPEEAALSAEKKVPIHLIEGRELRIDGYNVLATVEAMMRGEPVFLSNDGFVRDITSAYGSYRTGNRTEEAIKLLLRVISPFGARTTTLIFDEPVSGSGELSALARKLISDEGLRGVARTSKSPDLEVSRGEVVASSDALVISKADMVVDLPKRAAEEMGTRVLKFWKEF